VVGANAGHTPPKPPPLVELLRSPTRLRFFFGQVDDVTGNRSDITDAALQHYKLHFCCVEALK
jgi:hypothetical protein